MATNWIDTADGQGEWHDATSWSPNSVPNGASVDVTISQAGTYTVYIESNETYTVHDLTLGNANATLSDAGTLIVTGTAKVTNGTFFQQGTLLDLSAAGASLNVTGGTFNLHSGSIKGGTLSQSGSGVFLGGGTLDGTATAVTLTAGSTIRLTDNTTMALSGTFINAGTVSVASTGANVRLAVNNDVTLTGGGTIFLGETPANINAIRSNIGGQTSTLTNVNNTIKGAGALSGDSTPGYGTLAIVNQAAGIINATSATQALTIDSMILTNNGLVEATGAGGLVIDANSAACTLDQTGGGTLKAVGSGSHIDIIHSATIKGGTIATSGGGIVNATGAIFDGTVSGGLTITAGSNVKIGSGSLTLTGAIANSGTISVSGTAGNTRLLVDSAVTLTGGGSVVLNDGPNALFSFVTGSSLDNVDNTIRGSGEIALDKLLLTNEAGGTINATSANQALTIDSFGANNTLINKGLVAVTGAAGLTLSGVTLAQSGAGTLKAIGSGRHVDIVSSTIKGGTITTSGGGDIRIGAYANTLDGTVAGGLTITAGSTVRVLNANALHLIGAIKNAGTISLEAAGSNASLILDGTTTLTGGGTIALGNGATNFISASAANSLLDNVDNTIAGAGIISIGNLKLTNELAGTINANGTSALIIDGGFTNKGLIEATGSGVLQINGALDNIGIIQGVITENGGQTTVTADAPGQLHLTGGSGNNVFSVTTAPTHVDGGGGTDTLVIKASMTLGAGSLVSIEKITVGNGLDVDLGNITQGETIAVASLAGGGSTVHATKGDDIIVSGTGNDALYGNGGNDRFTVDSAKDVVNEAVGGGTSDYVLASVSYGLKAGSEVERLSTTKTTGTDAINLTGNELAQRIDGNDAGNKLVALDGNDSLYGFGGNDAIYGGAGKDMLVGGLGNDAFLFDTALNATTNVDTISDFHNVSGDNDTIRLDNAVFAALTQTGALDESHFKVITGSAKYDADDYIVYNADQSTLYYDADGYGGTAKAVAFAVLTAHPTLTAADFLVV